MQFAVGITLGRSGLEDLLNVVDHVGHRGDAGTVARSTDTNATGGKKRPAPRNHGQ